MNRLPYDPLTHLRLRFTGHRLQEVAQTFGLTRTEARRRESRALKDVDVIHALTVAKRMDELRRAEPA